MAPLHKQILQSIYEVHLSLNLITQPLGGLSFTCGPNPVLRPVVSSYDCEEYQKKDLTADRRIDARKISWRVSLTKDETGEDSSNSTKRHDNSGCDCPFAVGDNIVGRLMGFPIQG